MKIIDLDGREIEVTGLALALLQADDYRHYRAINPTAYDLRLQNYWEDFYQKLLLLDKEIKRMITYVKGNLLESPAVALVNTVNTVGVMGKGIALQFKNAFPHNFEVYKRACANGDVAIGKILAVEDRNLIYGNKLILNLPTKTHWRLPSEYIYIENGLVALRDYMIIHRAESIALPALGCGNGSLSWPKVKALIDSAFQDFDIPVWVYEP